MDLAAYLSRIGYDGPLDPGLPTLRGLHRRHLLSIPYGNIDVQLGRRLTLDPAKAFDKLVTRRRGGWCYEMNGLFAWALEKVGFSVTRLAGEVMRDERNPGPQNPSKMGGHLTLRVDIDGAPWLADVGFGDGLKAPIPLTEGEHVQGGHVFRLERLGGDWWRFHNHASASARHFDFENREGDAGVFAAACKRQQTAPDSTFVLNCVCQRHTDKGVSLLIGRVLHRPGLGVQVLNSPEELTATLAVEFDLDVPQAARLWPAICARHQTLFPA